MDDEIRSKGFMFYYNYEEMLVDLSDEELGQLVRALFCYGQGKEQIELHAGAAVAFRFISRDLERDTEKYVAKVLTSKENGAKGGRPKKARPEENPVGFSKIPEKPVGFSKIPEKPNNKSKTKTKSEEQSIQTPPEPPKGASGRPAEGAEKADLQDEHFAQFWSRYPKKVGKAAALKAWKRVHPDADLFARIMGKIEQFRLCEQWQRESGRFVPNPATWIGQGRWDDELTASHNSATQPQRPHYPGEDDAPADHPDEYWDAFRNRWEPMEFGRQE
jgi:hypothetical protein